MPTLYIALTEAGIEVDRAAFIHLNEANQVKVTDDVLTKMLKFITDKYNSLDFSEIEKSAGDFNRFKYRTMLVENLDMLRNVYQSSDDPGAAKYVEVIQAVTMIYEYLTEKSVVISQLYKSGNGLVQLIYTSLVSSCIYCVGILVSNTIRFVTVEQDTDCQVLFDEIPNTIKHVHIKNVMSAAGSLDTIDRVIDEFAKQKSSKMNESISIAAGVVIGIGVVIIFLPRLLMLIREIVYSIYYSRVKLSDMLNMQAQLIRTNIESLEAGRGNKKIVARQRRIAEWLEKWKDRIAVKVDTTEAAMKMQKKKEDQSLHINTQYIDQMQYDAGDGAVMI